MTILIPSSPRPPSPQLSRLRPGLPDLFLHVPAEPHPGHVSSHLLVRGPTLVSAESRASTSVGNAKIQKRRLLDEFQITTYQLPFHIILLFYAQSDLMLLRALPVEEGVSEVLPLFSLNTSGLSAWSLKSL